MKMTAARVFIVVAFRSCDSFPNFDIVINFNLISRFAGQFFL